MEICIGFPQERDKLKFIRLPVPESTGNFYKIALHK